VWQRIISQMPPHDLYCEPFVGGGAVFLHKRPAAVSVLVDADPAAVRRLASLALGGGGCPGIGPGTHHLGGGGAPAGLVASGAAGPEVHLLVGDGISYLESRRWAPGDLVYCDPPYPVALRRQHRRMYRCDLDAADHDRLVGVVQRLPCRVLVSGYEGEPYASGLSTWRVVRYRTRHHRGTVEECLWANYPEPVELHDWRYWGRDYRQREKVRRLVSRWVARWSRLPVPVRQAVLERIGTAPPFPVVAAVLSEGPAAAGRSAAAGVDVDEVPGRVLTEAGCRRVQAQRVVGHGVELLDRQVGGAGDVKRVAAHVE